VTQSVGQHSGEIVAFRSRLDDGQLRLQIVEPKLPQFLVRSIFSDRVLALCPAETQLDAERCEKQNEFAEHGNRFRHFLFFLLLPHRLIPRSGEIPLARVDFAALLLGNDLDFSEFSIPILVLGVVPKALLVMEFV
jgi:hypothetical protein